MENFIEAYGAFHNKMLFVAVRFQTPLVRVQIIEETSNKETQALTFFVGGNGHLGSGGISVKTGLESLLAVLNNKSDIYFYSYHNSVLYVCGAHDCVPFRYKRIPKTIAFKALYRITKAHQKGKMNIDTIVLCSYFRRNNLLWQDWKSWWYFIQDIMNDTFKAKVSRDITLQMVKLLKRVWKSSLREKNTYSIHPELSFCEITLAKTEQPGILCLSSHSKISYVSPMIVSHECYDFLPIRDKANVKCDRWFPLYTNKNNWFNHLIYFYVKQHKVNIKYIKNMLFFLKNTTITKYTLIEENLSLIYRFLTSKPNYL